jgi:hypothetical protein
VQVEYIVMFNYNSIIVKVIKISHMLKIGTVKPAYSGTAKGRTFFRCRFLLIQALGVGILGTEKYFVKYGFPLWPGSV